MSFILVAGSIALAVLSGVLALLRNRRKTRPVPAPSVDTVKTKAMASSALTSLSGGHAIAWTSKTISPIKGCTKCSSECSKCYAVQWAVRHQAKGSRGYDGTVKDGDFTGTIGIVPTEITRLAKVRADLVFVNSMSDTFHANVPDDTVRAMFEAMADNPHGTKFQICTKRAKRMAKFSQGYAIPDKVWCGVTVGCKKSLHRLNALRQVRAKVRWVSVEPLLEPLDLEPWLADGTLSWVVVGGESGPGYRPMDPAWAEAILRQCQKHGVPFFLKQWSARSPKTQTEYPPTIDGKVWHQFPA
jgi:protein gp37